IPPSVAKIEPARPVAYVPRRRDPLPAPPPVHPLPVAAAPPLAWSAGAPARPGAPAVSLASEPAQFSIPLDPKPPAPAVQAALQGLTPLALDDRPSGAFSDSASIASPDLSQDPLPSEDDGSRLLEGPDSQEDASPPSMPAEETIDLPVRRRGRRFRWLKGRL